STPSNRRPVAGTPSDSPRCVPEHLKWATTLSAGVELSDEFANAALDLIPSGTHLGDRASLRVFQVPIDVALARDERALIAAAHRDHDVGVLGKLTREQSGAALVQVDAELA